MVQTAKPLSLQKKKASQLQWKTQDGQIICYHKQKKETHEIERENLDIGQNATIERRGHGRVHSARMHREVADLRGQARAARELGANKVHQELLASYGCELFTSCQSSASKVCTCAAN